MQLNLIPAVFLFLGSYFPLSLILLVQDIKDASWKQSLCWHSSSLAICGFPELQNPGRAQLFFYICSLSLVLFFFFMSRLKGHHPIKIIGSRTIPNDLINYVFPYVVSFMGLELGNDGKVFGFIIFLILLFLITYRSGQILMNPLLLIAGWQLYEITAEVGNEERSLIALSNIRIKKSDELESCVIQGLYVLFKKD